MLDSREDGKQVPATIVTREGMQLVNHDRANARKQGPVVEACRNEDCL
jgi:hypothetical protein